jgi:hypothetical protein
MRRINRMIKRRRRMERIRMKMTNNRINKSKSQKIKSQ